MGGMESKALLLLSGGLDSTLAAKIMMEQGVELEAIHFTSPFCRCSGRLSGCGRQAALVAREFGIPLHIIPKGLDYMKVVERPRFGYGSGMNPCIDCRIFMLSKARELMPQLGASFIVTGEVLGQRPMSQHRHALDLIERESGLEGLILRPLSARRLAPTRPELQGVVEREKLLTISGRSRKEQIALARDHGIKDYPCPAGGCLLTDKTVAARLRDLFAHQPRYTLADLHLLTIGRHFRLSEGLKIILGRNQEENERIAALAVEGTTLIRPQGFRGPTALLVGVATNGAEETAGRMIAAYSTEVLTSYQLECEIKGQETKIYTVSEKYPRPQCEAMRIDALC